MFSKACEYAIRAMIYIAQNATHSRRVGLKDIAEGTGSPTHFIGKIMQDLSRNRLVQSVKGPNGGFYLTHDDLQISLAEVVKAIDGKYIYTDCVLGLKACSEVTPCPVHYQYKEVKRQLIAMIEENTLADFKIKLDNKECFLKNEMTPPSPSSLQADTL